MEPSHKQVNKQHSRLQWLPDEGNLYSTVHNDTSVLKYNQIKEDIGIKNQGIEGATPIV